MEQSPSWEANRFSAIKKFPAFYGTRRFITEFTNARHFLLSWANSIQSIPPTYHFLKIHLNIIIPSPTGSPKWSLSLRFPHQTPIYSSPLPHTRYMPRSFHSSPFYDLKNISSIYIDQWGLNDKYVRLYGSPVTSFSKSTDCLAK